MTINRRELDMADLTRRNACLGLVGLGLGSVPSEGLATPSINLNDPEENLEAYIRMRGDLTGRTVIERVDTRTLGIVEHEVPRPLFASVGIQVGRFRRVPEGFAYLFKYFSLTTDSITGQPITRFNNPYTNVTNEIPGRGADNNTEILLSPQGWRFPNRPLTDAQRTAPKLARPWQQVGDQLILTDTLISPPNYEKQPAFQQFTYTAPFRAATDRRRASVQSSFAGTGMEHWRPWMDIKTIEGSLSAHMIGTKVRRQSAFPAWLVEAALKYDAKMFDPL
jgi:hypothetical protein